MSKSSPYLQRTLSHQAEVIEDLQGKLERALAENAQLTARLRALETGARASSEAVETSPAAALQTPSAYPAPGLEPSVSSATPVQASPAAPAKSIPVEIAPAQRPVPMAFAPAMPAVPGIAEDAKSQLPDVLAKPTPLPAAALAPPAAAVVTPFAAPVVASFAAAAPGTSRGPAAPESKAEHSTFEPPDLTLVESSLPLCAAHGTPMRMHTPGGVYCDQCFSRLWSTER